MSDDTTSVGELRALIDKFVSDRDWSEFHDPKNLSMSIAIEAAELMEHFQWLRAHELPGIRNDAAVMEKVREEIADVLAFVLSFANAMDIDLSDALKQKMTSNEQRYPTDEFRGNYEKR
jgi:NTP pyrophosphatase (non-canonical NTP hydrolase)